MNRADTSPAAAPANASAPAGPFHLRRLALGGAGRGLEATLLRFEPALFSPDAFAAELIEMPPGIARSVRKRQAEFYFGRLAARHALAPLGHGAWTVGIGPSREPLWPGGVIGSISHCQGLAIAVALAQGPLTGIGIDAEDVVAPAMQATLAGSVVEPAEMALLDGITPALSAAEFLTIVFSAKESFFKGAFGQVGRPFGFEAARVVDFDPARRQLRLALTQALGARLPRGSTFRIDYGFIAPGKVLTSFIW